MTASALAAKAAKPAKPGNKPAKKTASRIITEDDLSETMRSLRGKVVVLHLWATWCRPCLGELPLIDRLTRESVDRGIVLYSASLDDPTPQAAAYVGQLVVEKGGTAMTNVILNVKNSDTFTAKMAPGWDGTLPVFILYDRAGNLRRASVGVMSESHYEKFVGDMAPPVKN